MRTYWCKDSIETEALKYNTRMEFRNACGGGYEYARRTKILDHVCSHMEVINIEWTHDKVKKEALNYEKRIDFYRANPSAYTYSLKNNIHNEVCSHMIQDYTYWTHEKAKKEALRYEVRSEFERGSRGAYNYTWANGLLDDVCSHMESHSRYSDNDALYIWEAVGERWNDKPIFKIGVTSKRLGETRIKQVAYTMGFEYKIHLLEDIDKAKNLEREILNKLCDTPTLTGSGYTEFRACSYEDMDEIINQLNL